MASLNMVKVNALIRKGYLLAGVVMAANMLAGNEMKAMKERKTNNLNEDDLNTSQSLYINKDFKKKKVNFLNSFLELENCINLGVGIFSSIANNYLKLLDYNPGWYRQFGCLGLRSKRFLNGVLQFDINLNIGRGCFWAILSAIGIFCECVDKNKKCPKTVAMYMVQNVKTEVGKAYFFITFLKGLISAPLTVHIAKFDFSISLYIDSIIWEIVRQICWREPSKGNKNNQTGFVKTDKDGKVVGFNFKTPVKLYNKNDNIEDNNFKFPPTTYN